MVHRTILNESFRRVLIRWSVTLALSLCGMPHAHAATPGELLQKAIYAEETVGNLDDAIQLYEQVVQQSKETTSAAAEAQYRLGLCLQKQEKPSLAAKAFQTLIDSYPTEKNWVAKAQQQLTPSVQLLPAPWKDGDRLTFELKLGSGIPVATMIYSVERQAQENPAVVRCFTRSYNLMNNGNSFSEVYCDAESFVPQRSMWMHDLLGEAVAAYKENQVTVTAANKTNGTTLDLDGNVWDNEQAFQLFRRLPLEIGYKDRITVLSALGGGKVPMDVEVTEKETIKTPAGSFECSKLVLSIGQTFWISTDEHRYVVQFEAPGIIAQLVDAQSLSPTTNEDNSKTKPVDWDSVNFTVPSSWYAYLPNQEEAKDTFRSAYLLDAVGKMTAEVKWGDVQTLKPEYRESVRAWSEGFAKDVKTRDKSFESSPEGIQEFKIGDVPACSLTAQRTEHGKKVVLYGVALMKGEKAMTVRFTMAPDTFEKEKATIDQIVNSLSIQ